MTPVVIAAYTMSAPTAHALEIATKIDRPSAISNGGKWIECRKYQIRGATIRVRAHHPAHRKRLESQGYKCKERKRHPIARKFTPID